MRNPRLTAMLLDLVALRTRPRRGSAPAKSPPARAAHAPQWRALQRRVVAGRPGGDSRPMTAARTLFDDVQ